MEEEAEALNEVVLDVVIRSSENVTDVTIGLGPPFVDDSLGTASTGTGPPLVEDPLDALPVAGASPAISLIAELIALAITSAPGGVATADGMAPTLVCVTSTLTVGTVDAMEVVSPRVCCSYQ